MQNVNVGPNAECRVIGWGCTYAVNSALQTSVPMVAQKLAVTTMAYERCINHYHFMHESQMCARTSGGEEAYLSAVSRLTL